ncbi:MAG: hypothetical protein GMKNLPBB_03089 [Myxococcota bacterium]|nr:hypothetical protein [Myxococcota bacterium]
MLTDGVFAFGTQPQQRSSPPTPSHPQRAVRAPCAGQDPCVKVNRLIAYPDLE